MKQVLFMRGSYRILKVGADQAELGVVQATSTRAALRTAARKFGVPVGRLDALEVLPPVYLKAASQEAGAGVDPR